MSIRVKAFCATAKNSGIIMPELRITFFIMFLPSSIFLERKTSCSAVSRFSFPISRRYRRIGSSTFDSLSPFTSFPLTSGIFSASSSSTTSSPSSSRASSATSSSSSATTSSCSSSSTRPDSIISTCCCARSPRTSSIAGELTKSGPTRSEISSYVMPGFPFA